MKKIISIALVAAVFGLVGCAAEKQPDLTAQRDFNVADAKHRPKCKKNKHGKYKCSKLGEEKTEKDTVK